jgi:hypothetical protein
LFTIDDFVFLKCYGCSSPDRPLIKRVEYLKPRKRHSSMKLEKERERVKDRKEGGRERKGEEGEKEYWSEGASIGPT